VNSLWRGALALTLASAGQFLLARYLPGLGESVDLFTILVVYYAVTRRQMSVMLIGTSAGFIEDVFTHAILGVNAFKKTLVGYLMGTLGSVFMLNQPLPRLGILFAATLLEAFTEVGLYLILGQRAILPSAGTLIRQGIGNGIWGALIFWIVSKVD
jgi:rod shape-determining protein MreD